MQIVVLGMHRSGTSMVTGLIHRMGAYFGSEDSATGASAENAKGFWERRDVRDLNDALLWSAGCDWHEVSRFRPGAVPARARRRFDAAARRLIGGLDAHRPWVIKEPRLCLLFPLWRPLLEAPACVLVYRCPLAVARSLAKRNGFPLPFGIALWERYVRDALSASAGLPRLLVGYEEVLADPVTACRRLRRRLAGLGVEGLRDPGREEILRFADPSLQHHRDAGGRRQELLNPEQLRLFQALEDGTALDWEDGGATSAEARRILAREEGRGGGPRAADSAPESEPPATEVERLYAWIDKLEEAYRRQTERYRALEEAYRQRQAEHRLAEALVQSLPWRVARKAYALGRAALAAMRRGR